MTTDPNEPIYPTEEYGNVGTNGLTKREYFAGLAIQGYIAGVVGIKQCDPEIIAAKAVNYADALIAELNRQRPCYIKKYERDKIK